MSENSKSSRSLSYDEWVKQIDRIEGLLKESGLSQRDLAEKIGTTYSAVNKWINGNSMPLLPSMIAMSKLFNCSLDYLAGLSDERKPREEWQGHWEKERGMMRCAKCGTVINDSQTWKYRYCPRCGRLNTK